MAIKSPGFVQVTTATTGFGPYTLTTTTPTANDYRTVAQAVTDGSLANGDTVHYCIFQTGLPSGKMFERGWGTINTATLVLTPTTGVERSAALTSGGGWGAGTKDVYFAPPGAESVALLEFANTFNQILTMNDKSIDIAVGGVIRGRLIYQANVLYLQYYSSGFALQGALQISNGAIQFNNGSTTYQVVKLLGGNVNKHPWYQAAAPTGWTKDTSQNDKAMRIVSGTGGGSGGSRALSSSVVGGTSLSVANLATHDHSLPITAVNVPLGEGATVNYLSGGGTITTTAAGSGTAHDHALALAYIDLINASLD